LGGVYSIHKPHRIIHCSDGIIEEFSDEEADQVDAAKIQEPPVDPVIKLLKIKFKILNIIF
jgi:hypothetical protein